MLHLTNVDIEILAIAYGKAQLKKGAINIYGREIFGRGGAGTSVEILFEISPECRNTFLPKSRIFRKFSRYFYTITPKITFYCIFINKFHKNFEKSAQKFFAAPSAPKTCRNISIFYPWSEDGTTPLEGSPPK